MDALAIRARISPARSMLLATLAAASGLVGAACTPSGHDAEPAYRATYGQDRARARALSATEADAGPAAESAPRAPSRSPAEFARLESAIRRFAGDRAGRLPVSLAELTTERSPEGDHYLASIPTDVWGRPYSYAVESARLGIYDLRSFGPDALPGTGDDVVADPTPVPVH